MVDRNAAKWALLVGGAILAVLVAGQVLRFVTRMLAWSVLALLAAVAVYVVYQVLKGAGDAAETAEDATTGTTTVDDLKQQYASGNLSEAEFERELDAVMGAGRDDAETWEPAQSRDDETSRESETSRR